MLGTALRGTPRAFKRNSWNDNLRKSYLDYLRRLSYQPLLRNHGSSILHIDHRNSVRSAVVQDGRIRTLSIRKQRDLRHQRHGLPLYHHEHHMDCLRRYRNLSATCRLRSIPLPYYCRNPSGGAAFQNGSACTCSFRTEDIVMFTIDKCDRVTHIIKTQMTEVKKTKQNRSRIGPNYCRHLFQIWFRQRP